MRHIDHRWRIIVETLFIVC